MKTIIKITTLLAATLLLFASCEKADSPIEKTWKMTINTPVPKSDAPSKRMYYGDGGFTDIYFTISGRSVILSVNMPKYIETLVPQYRGYLVVTGTGTFTQIETTKTSGKIIFEGLDLPWSYGGRVEFEYRNLTSTSMTLVINDAMIPKSAMPEPEELVFTLTAVKNRPNFITQEELRGYIPYS